MSSTVSLPQRHLRPTRRAPAPPKPNPSSPTSKTLTLPDPPVYHKVQPAAKHVRTRSLFTPSLKSLKSPAPSFRTLRCAARSTLETASREAEEREEERRILGRPESLISLERFVREELGDGGGWSSLVSRLRASLLFGGLPKGQLAVYHELTMVLVLVVCLGLTFWWKTEDDLSDRQEQADEEEAVACASVDYGRGRQSGSSPSLPLCISTV